MAIVRGPRVVRLEFAGSQALELKIVFRVGLQDGTMHVSSRTVHGIPLPGLPLGARAPRSTLEVFVGTQVVYRRAFEPPSRVEVYGDRGRWARLPVGYKQVLVTLLPVFPGASRIVGTGPMGTWLQHALL
jgi:hypothetical protein